MLPIYIICHADCEPSAYLCTYLDKKNIAYKKFNVLNNDVTTLKLDEIAGMIIMGGPFSVYDSHPWLDDEIKLIRRAIEKDLLLMGVCFGAQLISKALGSEVSMAEHMETGWHEIVFDNSQLEDFEPLNLDNRFEVFEWHEDEFTIPDGAIPIFSGHNRENQGYVYGKVLAMQFHLEMTEHLVYEWLERYHGCITKPSDYVQSPEIVTDRLHERLDSLHALADKIYDWWLNMARQN